MFKRFVLGVLKLGAALTVAALLLILVVWQWSERQERARKAAEAPLAEKKAWPSVALEPLGNARVGLATMWRDGKIYYKVDVDGYPPSMAAARDSSGNARFILTFSDSNGFKMFEQSIQLREMTAVVTADGRRDGLSWANDQFLAVDDYRKAAQWELTWAGFPETEAPRPAAATPKPAPPRSQWRNRSLWRQLSVGMSEDSVRALLGEPTRINRYGPMISSWEYGTILDGGSISFDGRGVNHWSEPQ
jgi:hypothetical protein